jgi:hypothetical protein
MGQLLLAVGGALAFWWLLFGTFRVRRVGRVLRVDVPPREPLPGFLGLLQATASDLKLFLWAILIAIYGALLSQVLESIPSERYLYRLPASAFAFALPVLLVGVFGLFLRLARHLNLVAQRRPRLLPRTPRPLRYVWAVGLAYMSVMVVGTSVQELIRGLAR